MNIETLAYAPSLPGQGQGASSTSEFEFQNSARNAGGVSPANAEFTVEAGALNHRHFILTALGRVTGATTTNFTVKIYVGTALGTLLFTSGALAVNSTSGSFMVVVEGSVDSTGNVVAGIGYGAVNATAITQAVATAALSPANPVTFSCSGTFSASNAGNVAFLDEFSLEVD